MNKELYKLYKSNIKYLDAIFKKDVVSDAEREDAINLLEAQTFYAEQLLSIYKRMEELNE